MQKFYRKYGNIILLFHLLAINLGCILLYCLMNDVNFGADKPGMYFIFKYLSVFIALLFVFLYVMCKRLRHRSNLFLVLTLLNLFIINAATISIMPFTLCGSSCIF